MLQIRAMKCCSAVVSRRHISVSSGDTKCTRITRAATQYSKDACLIFAYENDESTHSLKGPTPSYNCVKSGGNWDFATHIHQLKAHLHLPFEKDLQLCGTGVMVKEKEGKCERKLERHWEKMVG